MRNPKCGKVCHKTKNAAKIAAQNTPNFFGVIFYCDRCNAYHIGHTERQRQMLNDLKETLYPSVPCQECKHYPKFIKCGWCKGTKKVSYKIKGLWLNFKKMQNCGKRSSMSRV